VTALCDAKFSLLIPIGFRIFLYRIDVGNGTHTLLEMTDSESERKTRRTRIDPKLASAGWSVAPFDASRTLSDFAQCAIEEYETNNGPADYALNVDSVLLGARFRFV
jgi:hypothetical protein